MLDDRPPLTPRTMLGLKHTTSNVRAMVDRQSLRLDVNTLLRDAWDTTWDLVFTRPDGRPLLPDVVSRAFRRQAERLALPRASLNSIRHVHATLLLQAGVPVKVVSERLGHSTIRLTLDIYAHVLPAMDAEAVERFAALLDAADPS